VPASFVPTALSGMLSQGRGGAPGLLRSVRVFRAFQWCFARLKSASRFAGTPPRLGGGTPAIDRRSLASALKGIAFSVDSSCKKVRNDGGIVGSHSKIPGGRDLGVTLVCQNGPFAPKTGPRRIPLTRGNRESGDLCSCTFR
jgi:hypothetical protein